MTFKQPNQTAIPSCGVFFRSIAKDSPESVTETSKSPEKTVHRSRTRSTKHCAPRPLKVLYDGVKQSDAPSRTRKVSISEYPDRSEFPFLLVSPQDMDSPIKPKPSRLRLKPRMSRDLHSRTFDKYLAPAQETPESHDVARLMLNSSPRPTFQDSDTLRRSLFTPIRACSDGLALQMKMNPATNPFIPSASHSHHMQCPSVPHLLYQSGPFESHALVTPRATLEPPGIMPPACLPKTHDKVRHNESLPRKLVLPNL